jgi:putative hydrolase of the HAD superfamily
MHNIQTVFFDLDHTLWDFNVSCAETLEELYHIYDLKKFQFDVPSFQKKYREVNDRMWEGYHRNEVTKEQLRNERFKHTFTELGIDPLLLPEYLDQHFIKLCPTKPNLHPHTKDILEYLTGKKYQLFIVTNGFPETQHIKLSSAKIDHYFKDIIHPERAGAKKPLKTIFDYSCAIAQTNPNNCIMIGDDLEADVLGALDAGLHAIYYNPSSKKNVPTTIQEIQSLKELQLYL